MRQRLAGLGVVLAFALAAGGSRPGARSRYNGLGLGMGTLSRLSKAKTRSISPENFTGEKGKGGMATEGTGANAARELGRGWKVSPSVRIKAKSVFTLADVSGQGAIQHIWMTPTGNWRYTILRFYWDGETTPSVEVPVGDFFANGWGQLRADHLAGRDREPRQRVQLLLGDAVPQVVPHHRREPGRRRHDALLPDRLHADRRARGRRVLPRAVPAREPAAVQGRLHDPRRRQGLGPLRRHLPGLGRQQQRLVGRGRDQVLPRRRRRVPDDLRHRHRGLLLRLVQLREPEDEAVPGVHDAVLGPRAGDPARTASTTRSSASGCTAGTSWTRCASSRTCA